MKKLSEIIRLYEAQNKEKKLSLVLFDNVLDGEKVLQCKELKTLTRDILGHGTNGTISVKDVDDPEKLQDWLRDEQYKSIAGGQSMIYQFKKTKFEDLAEKKCSDEYSGPLSAIIFSPETDSQVITLCCHWKDGKLPIRNDEAIVGVIEEDLDRMQL